jgi:hypothetical protein
MGIISGSWRPAPCLPSSLLVYVMYTRQTMSIKYICCNRHAHTQQTRACRGNPLGPEAAEDISWSLAHLTSLRVLFVA